MIKKIGLAIFLFSFISVAKADVNELLTQLPFSQLDQQKILQGELVTIHIDESAEDELAVIMAFIAKTSADKIKKHYIKGSWIDLLEAIITYKELTATSTITDFSGLNFSSEQSIEINNYLSAQAGDDLNLSRSEIKQLQSINSVALQADGKRKAVEEQIHKMLLNRFNAYRKGGVDAISPYLRDQETPYFLGEYIKKITQFDSILQQYYPVFYKALKNYPHNNSTELQESFFALKMEVQDRPTFALMHRMLMQEGDAVVISLRHFYASQSYNGEQDLGLFIPIDEGVLILGLFRTSSVQVAGFGSSVKHAIGRRLLASILTKYYLQVQQLLKTQ